MILVTALDAGVVELACVMLASISAENKALISEIYVLEDGLSASDRSQLTASIDRPLIFLDVSERLKRVFGKIYSQKRVTMSSYSRHFITELIDERGQKVLYLDADTLVLGSLAELEHLDMTGFAVAAVETTYGIVAKWLNELGLPAGMPFLNGGVILINPPEWRRQRVTERMIAFLEAFQGPQRFVDQGGFNAAIAGHFLKLPSRWNMREKDFRCLSHRANSPIIVHFTGAYKPNMRGCPHPGTRYFLQLRKRTPYRDRPLLSPGDQRRHNIVRRTRRFMRRFGAEVRFWLAARHPS